MRQNFDYVTMPDYQADMKETADHASTVINHLQEKATNWQRALAAVVIAAGGKVSVRAVDLTRLSQFETEIRRDDANDEFIFCVRRTT